MLSPETLKQKVEKQATRSPLTYAKKMRNLIRSSLKTSWVRKHLRNDPKGIVEFPAGNMQIGSDERNRGLWSTA